MFLCVSPNFKDWKLSKKLLLLGSWCLNEKDDLSKLNYEIMPYHWEDDIKFQKDLKYLFELYKDIIPEITTILNQRNNKNFSSKYWEILIGPWLWQFTQVLFDRYSSILKAVDRYENLETWITETSHSPRTFMEFDSLLQNDDYNFIIFSKIIKTLNSSIKISKTIELRDFDNENYKFIKNEKITSIRQIKNNIKLILKNFSKRVNSFIFTITKKNNYEFFNINIPISSFHEKQLYKLLNINYHKIYKKPEALSHKVCEVKFNFDSNKLKQKYINDNFIKLLLDQIFIFMPTEYNSDFNLSRNHYIKFLSNGYPKVAGIRCPIETNPLIRFSISELVEKGTKIIACQEGGGDGSKISNLTDEEFRTRLCDIFLTWGWENKKNHKVKKFYITKNFPKNINYNKEGDIILVGASCRKYFFSSSSGQLPSYNDTLIKFNTNFIENLNKDSFKKLIYRFHWEMGFNERKRVQKIFPRINISTREKSTYFYDLLSNSKLIIISTDYTTNKQCFLLNHPTLLLWDSEYFKIRNETKKYYNQLYKAGILFFSPELCAQKVNLIEKDPWTWWKSENVQKAKNDYCDYLCRESNDLPFEISKLIKEL